MRYLVTGHTGFKGAWLSLWLAQEGHEVHGIALDPEASSLYERADIVASLSTDTRLDIRDASALNAAVQRIKPEIVVHLAAQPLVRESYRQPAFTVETNVIGTMHLLEATRMLDCVEAQLIITTDKVYRNVNRREGYREDEPLGGHDPYSASKAMSDLLVQSWAASFDLPPTAIARAGNVIGGGDESTDRLMPDLVHAYASGSAPRLRYPDAVRPWQHELDCLNGYRCLVRAVQGGKVPQGSAWNFGPDASSFVSVGDVATLVGQMWGSSVTPTLAEAPALHEAGLLALDSSQARVTFGWTDLLSYEEAISWTVSWYRDVYEGGREARAACEAQLRDFREALNSLALIGQSLDQAHEP